MKPQRMHKLKNIFTSVLLSTATVIAAMHSGVLTALYMQSGLTLVTICVVLTAIWRARRPPTQICNRTE